MNKLKLAIALSLLMATQTLMAVPAKQTPSVFTQPDGTTVVLQKVGDERRHITITPEGYPVTLDSKGFYCYAELDQNGKLKASAVKASATDKLSEADLKLVKSLNPNAIRQVAMSNQATTKFSAPSRIGKHGGIGLVDDAFLGRKELKGLVILAQYSDVKFSSTCDNNFFVDMLNKEGFNRFGGTGSARDYFIDASSGKFIPTFDVYGPVTLPRNMKYYGGNDADGNDQNPAQMIYDACLGLDSEINFKDYDLDGDGFVDNVFVFYAGKGEASYGSDDTIWPHKWDLTSAGLSLTLDGVRIHNYACSNELEEGTTPDGIGTFVHEFSHVLGLPDLYDTSGEYGNWTPGPWSVLDQGPYNNNSRTPPTYSIYERNALGWIDPIEIDGRGTFELEAINVSNQGCIIPTADQNEFFLLENRQQTGWDEYIPGHGLLIWHIDYNSGIWQRNSVNNTKSHNYVDIEEASGTLAVYTGNNYESYMRALAAYAFPGTKGVTSFTDDTAPSMRTWDNKKLGLPITEIAEKDGVISFNVQGGKCDAETPVVRTPAEVGDDFFVASWNASEGAAEYFLTVQGVVGSGKTETVTADFGSSSTAKLPDGWQFISTRGDTYTTNNNYGESAPSLKLSSTGAGIMTCMFDDEVKSIKFWLKGMSTDKLSKVTIEGRTADNDNWTTLRTVGPTNMKATDVSIDGIDGGIRQIRICYTKSKGNVAIDDVKITFGGGIISLDGYNDLAVGNTTSFRVDKLPQNVSTFIYKVRAADAEGHRTGFSDEQTVTLGSSAGIESVIDNRRGSYTLAGKTISYSGAPGLSVRLTDISGRTISAARTDASGNASLTTPSAGIYLLIMPGQTAKIIIQ